MILDNFLLFMFLLLVLNSYLYNWLNPLRRFRRYSRRFMCSLISLQVISNNTAGELKQVAFNCLKFPACNTVKHRFYGYKADANLDSLRHDIMIYCDALIILMKIVGISLVSNRFLRHSQILIFKRLVLYHPTHHLFSNPKFIMMLCVMDFFTIM